MAPLIGNLDHEAFTKKGSLWANINKELYQLQHIKIPAKIDQ